MKLRTIGLKGHDQSVTLDRLMLLTGPNGSGKSTLAEAVRFLALGYVPALGKRLQDTATLLRGSWMEVSLTLDDGRVLRRWMESSGKGFRSGADCSWLFGGKTQEHHAEILKLFGREELDVAEGLDIRELLNATPARREERIAFLLASGSAPPREKAARAVRGAAASLLGVPPDRLPEGAADLFRPLPAAAGEPLRESSGRLESEIREGGLAAAISWANEQKRRASQELHRKVQARTELETRLAQLPAVSAELLGSLESERQRLERELGALEEKALERSRRQAHAAVLDRRLEAAEEEFGAARAERSAAEDDAPATASLAQSLAAVEKDLDALAAPLEPEPPEAAERRAAAREWRREASSIREPEVPDAAEIERRRRACAEAAEALERSPWSEVLEIAEDLARQARGEPSFSMYRVLDRARRLSRLASATLGRDRDELRAREAGLREEHARALRAAEEAAAAWRRRDELASLARDAEARADELLRNATLARERAAEEGRRKRVELLARRDLYRGSLSEAAERERAAALRLERARVALEALRKQRAEFGPAEAAGELDPERLHARLHALGDEISTLARTRAAIAELELLASEARRLEASRDVAAALERSLERLREEEIREAGGPLVRGMTSFLRAAGRAESPFFDAENGRCRVGWRTAAGREVAAEALSGGEWCLFAAALTATVLGLRGGPIRILVVEAGETDEPTLRAILSGIRSIRDRLTAGLVLTPRELSSEGWTVLRPAAALSRG